MLNKVGIIVSTAARAGSNKVSKALTQQMFWLGIAKVFKYSKIERCKNQTIGVWLAL